jgi:beta-lactamase class D
MKANPEANRMTRFYLKHSFLAAGLLVLVSACVGSSKKTEMTNSDQDYFAGAKGCFLLYDMKSKSFKKVIGEENCRERFVACSTFKVPLSVMAFDSGVLKDESQVLKWNGEKGFLKSHDQDHNAKTWMRDSVVWFSQRLTPQLGREKVQQYLHDFKYGNEDFSGDITHAWLVSPGDNDPAVKISAYEQVEFMKNLWTDNLPVSKRATRITRDLTFLETSPHGFKLNGKTGSNYYDHDYQKEKRLGFGWFVSHLEKGDQEYIAVANLSDLTPTDQKQYGGLRAKQITKKILMDEGLW